MIELHSETKLINVELGLKVIPDEQKIFRVYSGHGRRFFEEFVKFRVAFLELPGAEITPSTFASVEDTRQHVRRARDIADYCRSNNRIPNLKFMRLNQYDGKPDRDDRSGNSLIGSVTSLYRDARKGDLIISPSSGPYREVLYGEIEEEFSANDTIQLEAFGDLKVPVRKVRWFKRTSQSDLIPYELSKHVTGRKAVAHIQRTGSALRFYDIAYGSYVTSDSSRAEISADLYRSDNFFQTSEMNDKIGYLIAAYLAVSSQASVDVGSLADREAIKRFIEKETLEYYKQHFNSPGWSAFKSKIRDLGPVVLIVFALAAAGLLATVADGQNVEVLENFDSSVSESCAQFSVGVQALAESIGVERCRELENQISDLASELGVEVEPKVIEVPDITDSASGKFDGAADE